jgi:penicillin-binding protein 1A
VAVAKTAYRLGIASKLEANPSLALGTSEVSLIELVSAYAPFANGGDSTAPHVVERVRTHAGKVLYARDQQSFGGIVESRYVAMMNSMMRETLLIGTAQKAQVPGWPAAGKTGTSQDFRDAWFIGYTSHLVAGVWLGNDDPPRKGRPRGLPAKSDPRGAAPGRAGRGVPASSVPSLAAMFPPWWRRLRRPAAAVQTSGRYPPRQRSVHAAGPDQQRHRRLVPDRFREKLTAAVSAANLGLCGAGARRPGL